MPFRFAWIIIGSLALVDAAWMAIGGRTLVNPSPKLFAAAILATGAIICRAKSPRIADRMESLAQNLFALPVLLIFVYLCASANFPLRDDWLAAADRAIGFDWLWWYQLASSSRVAMDALGILYYAVFVVQSFVLLFLLPLISPRRSVEFIVAFVLTATACSLISMLIPAIGALFHFGAAPDPQLHAMQVIALETLAALREGGTKVIDFAQANSGIIMFPSFHTASALLYSYAAWGTGRLFRVVVVLNALMLLSVPIIGTHYLADMIAGAIVAVAAIAATRVIFRTRAATGTGLDWRIVSAQN